MTQSVQDCSYEDAHYSAFSNLSLQLPPLFKQPNLFQRVELTRDDLQIAKLLTLSPGAHIYAQMHQHIYVATHQLKMYNI